jgi:hypothetical protein
MVISAIIIIAIYVESWVYIRNGSLSISRVIIVIANVLVCIIAIRGKIISWSYLVLWSRNQAKVIGRSHLIVLVINKLV